MPNESISAAADVFESVVSAALEGLPAGVRLLAAVSGGADSCAMLFALSRLQTKLGFSLSCVHIVHGIRPSSEGDAEAALVRSLCGRLRVPCSVVEIPRGRIAERAKSTGKGMEDAARFFRHAALSAEAERIGAFRVLLGHTENDLLETALMRFLRGSGPAGLSSLPAERGRILRPLLRLSRADVMGYVESFGIPYADDPSNADPHFLRNRIRHHLMPVLNRDFPGWKSAVKSLADTQADVARFISAEARARIAWTQSTSAPRCLEVGSDVFFSADPVVRAEALYQALDAVAGGGRGGVSADAPASKAREPTRRAVALFASGARKTLTLGRARACVSGGLVVVGALEHLGESAFSIAVGAEGDYRWGDLAFRIGRDQTAESVWAVLPLVMRTPALSELPRLRAASFGHRPARSPLFVIEDASGFDAFAERDASGRIKLHADMRKSRVTDYAQSVFFSIL